MIQDHINKIEEMLKQSKTVQESDKDDLLTILAVLRMEVEIAELPQTHHEQSESTVRFAELSAHEAISNKKEG